MANSRAGQYQIEYNIAGWSAPTRVHAHRFYVAPVTPPVAGAPMSTIPLQARGGGTVNADVAANAYWEFLRLMYNNGKTCTAATLWYFTTNTIRTFISSVSLTNTAGSGTATIDAQQLTLSFRTALGGVIKLVLLETNQAGVNLLPLVPNAAGTPPQRLAAHVMSASGVALGIDNSFPITALADARGQNESVAKLLYR